MLYQVPPIERNECTAWAKAPADVHDIALRVGFVDFPIDSCRIRKRTILGRAFALLRWWKEELRIHLHLKRGDVILFNLDSPILERRGANGLIASLARRGIRLVLFVHDIEALRFPSKAGVEHDIAAFVQTACLCDKVIVHNDRMKTWCVKRGIPSDRLVTLQLFDYLLPSSQPSQPQASTFHEVVIAGNLDAWKAGYLSQLSQVSSVDWNLYGPNFDPARITGDNVHYRGCYSPEELPQHLSGRFGLVWDGDSIDTCAGLTGDYLRLITPHKISLYLAAGLPVIVWSESALADYVTEHNLGLTIASLRDLPQTLASLPPTRYADFQKNVLAHSTQLQTGAYTTTVLSNL